MGFSRTRRYYSRLFLCLINHSHLNEHAANHYQWAATHLELFNNNNFHISKEQSAKKIQMKQKHPSWQWTENDLHDFLPDYTQVSRSIVN